MKKRFVIFLILFSIFGIQVVFSDSKVPGPEENFYVNDFANVINLETKALIIERAIQINKDTGKQFCISTVETTNGEDISRYSSKMYNQYKIGKDNQGALLLIATKDRKVRIEVGRKMESEITDGISGQILDSITPYLAKNDWSQAAYEGFRLIAQRGAKVEMDTYDEVFHSPESQKRNSSKVITDSYSEEVKLKPWQEILLLFFIAIMFIILIPVLIFRSILSFLNPFNWFWGRKNQNKVTHVHHYHGSDNKRVFKDVFSTKSKGDGGSSRGGGANRSF